MKGVRLLFVCMIVSCDAKKSNKMQEMLQKADVKKTLIEEDERDTEDSKFNLPGVQHKIKLQADWFEYEGKHGVMTSEEAINDCEADPACGGFSYYGTDSPGRKHFVFFHHFIPYLNKRNGGGVYPQLNPSWTLYKSKKKIIKLAGVPMIRHEQLAMKQTKEVEAFKKAVMEDNDLAQNWPKDLAKVASVSLSTTRAAMTGETVFIMKDHDFNAPGFTLVNNELTTSSNVFDGSMKQFWPCCRAYTKPLEDPEFRFNEFHDNIDTIDCKGLTKEDFEEKFVRTKTPVKIKGCFKDLTMPDINGISSWSGQLLVSMKTDKRIDHLTTAEVKRLIEAGATIDFVGAMPYETPSLNFYPDNILKNRNLGTFAAFNSKGTGLTNSAVDADTFRLLHKGSIWTVILPPGVGGVHCSCGDQVSKIWQSATWFDNIQPQLVNSRTFGKPVVQTRQEPGDIVYIPSNSRFSYNALEDAFGVTSHKVTVGGIDSLKPESIEDLIDLDSAEDMAVIKNLGILYREFYDMENEQGLDSLGFRINK